MSDARPPRLTRTVALPGEQTSVAAARRIARETVREWGLAAAEDDAALVVTELVANAVRHAAGEVTVALWVDHGLHVQVRDRGSPGRTEVLFPAEDLFAGQGLAEHGRGLRIVAALSDEWGARREGDGAVVWCRLGVGPGRDDATVHTMESYRSAARAWGPVTGGGGHGGEPAVLTTGAATA